MTSGPGVAARRRRRVWPRVLLALLVLAGVLVVAAGLLLWKRPLATFQLLGRLALRGAGLERARLDAPRGPLDYWRGGEGPLVVLLHGANDSSGAFSRVAGPLLARHRVLVPDLPGHGGSAPLGGPLTVGDLLAGVEALLETEGRGEKATLVGNSMGGWLALLYAHRHPDRTAHVVLLNGAALSGDGSEAKVNLLPRNREEARAAMRAVTSPASPPTPDFILDDLVRRARGSPLARLLASSFGEHLLDGRLSEVAVPVTLLWGEDDSLMPVSYARRVAAELPTARLELVPRCGHVPQRECPQRLLPLLGAALAEPSTGAER